MASLTFTTKPIYSYEDFVEFVHKCYSRREKSYGLVLRDCIQIAWFEAYEVLKDNLDPAFECRLGELFSLWLES